MRREEIDIQSEDMGGNPNIVNVGKGVGIIERILNLISKYKIWDFIKAFMVMIMLAIIIGFIARPNWIFDRWEQYEEKRHKEKMEIVERNNAIIHNELETILYKTGANRVLLLSYHNSKQSLVGLPYIYLTAVNEAINYDVSPVAEEYESIKTSIYPMINYLNKEGYFCGDIEDLRTIDKALGYRLMGNDVRHLSMLQIEGEYPLGVLVVTYTNALDKNHKCIDTETVMRRAGVRIGVLLEGKNKL